MQKTGSTHFVDVVQSNDGIKVCVEVVEQVDHLDGFTESRDGCETDDVAEVQRDLAEVLGYDGFACLQRFGHGPEREPWRLNLTPATPCSRTIVVIIDYREWTE